MSDIDKWLKDNTGTDFFTLTTPKDEVTPEALFLRAVTNELGVVVIPKDRNIQLRDLLPVVIVDTNRTIKRGRLSSEGLGESISPSMSIPKLEIEAMPRSTKLYDLNSPGRELNKIKPEKRAGAEDLLRMIPLDLDKSKQTEETDNLLRLIPLELDKSKKLDPQQYFPRPRR
jgi:hypothetical protein